jgi:hypothetical protein
MFINCESASSGASAVAGWIAVCAAGNSNGSFENGDSE